MCLAMFKKKPKKGGRKPKPQERSKSCVELNKSASKDTNRVTKGSTKAKQETSSLYID